MALLEAQARIIDPITYRFFETAGISPGMRVLDCGSGAGDVAFLAADLVGETGAVVGADRSAAALTTARRRADARGLRNVSFVEGDPAVLAFDQPFDAVLETTIGSSPATGTSYDATTWRSRWPTAFSISKNPLTKSGIPGERRGRRLGASFGRSAMCRMGLRRGQVSTGSGAQLPPLLPPG